MTQTEIYLDEARQTLADWENEVYRLSKRLKLSADEKEYLSSCKELCTYWESEVEELEFAVKVFSDLKPMPHTFAPINRNLSTLI